LRHHAPHHCPPVGKNIKGGKLHDSSFKKDGKMTCINSLRLDTELRTDNITLWCLDENVRP